MPTRRARIIAGGEGPYPPLRGYFPTAVGKLLGSFAFPLRWGSFWVPSHSHRNGEVPAEQAVGHFGFCGGREGAVQKNVNNQTGAKASPQMR